MNNDENGDKFDAIRVEQASEYAHIIPLLSVFFVPYRHRSTSVAGGQHLLDHLISSNPATSSNIAEKDDE
jgi:hypothetical protein